MVRKVRVTLSSILSHAQVHGRIGRNIIREIGRQNGRNRQRKSEQKRKLKVGLDIPELAEVSAMLMHAGDKWRPLILVAAFTGLRAGELRALPWRDVDLSKGEIHVRQSANKRGEIYQPKSEAGERTIPVGQVVVSTLREWKRRCPRSELDLVFPSEEGTVQRLENVIRRGFQPAQIGAGVIKTDNKPKYPGIHSLRHFYASWLINRKVDGGRELPPKTVQERMGHSGITITLDRYGHLFPAGDDTEIDAAELSLLNAAQMRHTG